MNLGTNKNLIDVLKNKNVLLDAVFLDLYLNNENGIPSVFLRIIPRINTLVGILELTLKDIHKFDFFFEKENMLFEIERYKFFIDNQEFCYLSLDPYDEENSPNSKDCALIICKEISGYLKS